MRWIVSLLLIFSALAAPVFAADGKSPAGYVISFSLLGADRDAGTAVIRDGKELKPKLWMPVFAGDTVFVRDPASAVMLDMGEGGRIEVTGAKPRFEAQGEIPTGDDAWSIISSIGAILSGGDETTVVPTNLVSKGDGTLIPYQADNGPNFVLKSESPLRLTWKGGKGPFKLAAEVDGQTIELATVTENFADVAVPAAALDRFAIVIADASGQKVRLAFRIRKSSPVMPDSLVKSGPSVEFGSILRAAWLADRQKGAWRLEAARQLLALSKQSAVAKQLLIAMTGQGG